MKPRILLVEDADSLREVVSNLLERKGYLVDSFADAESALPVFKKQTYACILADFKLPAMNGIDLLRAVRNIDPEVPYLIMTAFGSISIAVEAMKEGANDFLQKPFEPEALYQVIDEIIEHKQIIDRSLGRKTRRNHRFLTTDSKVETLLNQAQKVARVNSSVLITGESGTGKELIARYIHANSSRKDKPFVAVNCAAVPADLLESEFFGHEAGSYTGATQQRIGVFEYASEGTIFLDEIGDMPAALQVKLLRVLQENEVKRVGGNKMIAVAPRIIAATNKDIEKAIAEKKLREDFYYRLAVITFTLPPLRDRIGDIELLSDYYVEYFSNMTGKQNVRLSREAKSLLARYPWPGNSRELENVIERAVILAEKTIQPEHLGITLSVNFDTFQEACGSLQEIASAATRKAEIEAISQALSQTLGNKSKAARLLGVSYKTLLNKVKEYELQPN